MDITEDFMLTPRKELKWKSPLQIMLKMAKQDVKRHGQAWGFGSQGALPKSNEVHVESGAKSKRGRKGDPRVKERRAKIMEMYNQGVTPVEIAKHFGLSRKTVWGDIAIAEGRSSEQRRRRARV